MNLSNHKILITGGNKGIGLALAKKFLSLDNQVIILGRNQTDLNQVKQQHPAIETIRCDLTNNKELDQLILHIEQYHPDLNILVNNAGIQMNYELITDQHPINKIHQEVTINFLSPLILTTHLLPLLQQNPNPSIINVSSALGFVPKKSAPVYCATKAGIHIFSKSLRDQLDDIKVFEIIPSLVDTEMTSGRGKNKITPEQLTDEFIKAFKRDQYEINIGKVNLLRGIHRISPSLAQWIINGS